jgi:uncharacterized protein YecE (DUF72 family)
VGASGRLRVGCSGWQYRHWRGDFYPRDLPQSRWLDHYATVFDTVEVNNSFYRLPERETFETWKKRTPAGFLFALKASRYLTHMKKLKDPEEPISRFFERANGLGRKLGPVLYQLPPRWPRDLERLEAFLRLLPKRRLHVFEFRDPSWYGEETERLLGRAGAALCLHDMRGSESPRRFVSPFVYVRFHGSGAKYGGRYPDHVIGDWAAMLARELERRRNVYAYFNNDWEGHAPRDAVRLREAIASQAASRRTSGLKVS